MSVIYSDVSIFTLVKNQTISNRSLVEKFELLPAAGTEITKQLKLSSLGRLADSLKFPEKTLTEIRSYGDDLT